MSAKTIYKTLAPFFDAVDGTEEKALKFTAPGYMDLCIEALGYNDHEGRPVYSVAHYGEQNGDLMRDPDVTMGVDRETGTVEPLTYQNDYIGRYWEVYTDFVDGKPTKYYPAMKKDLAAMVTAWAKNIKAQVVKVPGEYPAEDLSTVLLYEPEEAAKIFAQLCGYTLLDQNGRVITGRMPGREEQK